MPRETVYLGAGTLSLIDNTVTPAEPVQPLALQDASLDYSFETKELMGENQQPIAEGRVGQKWTLKAKTGDISGKLFAKGLGFTTSSGGELVAKVSAAAAASVTPTVPGSGTWSKDLGVRSSTGTLMAPVASSPVAGVSYTVSAGAYGFNASESGNIEFRFLYTVTTGVSSGEVVQIAAGAAPTFEGISSVSYTNPDGTVNSRTIHLYAMALTKLSESRKRDGFSEADVEFTCYARPSDGKVGKITSAT